MAAQAQRGDPPEQQTIMNLISGAIGGVTDAVRKSVDMGSGLVTGGISTATGLVGGGISTATGLVQGGYNNAASVAKGVTSIVSR